jgi:hypothetical protein
MRVLINCPTTTDMYIPGGAATLYPVMMFKYITYLTDTGKKGGNHIYIKTSDKMNAALEANPNGMIYTDSPSIIATNSLYDNLQLIAILCGNAKVEFASQKHPK